MGTGYEDRVSLTFNYVRSFLFFKESDFYDEVARGKRAKLIEADDGGVYRLADSSILQSVLRDRLSEEIPSYYWVITPDECLEVVGFEDPQVGPLA